MILVQRTFHLHDGYSEEFLNRLSKIHDDLQNDETIQTFAVVRPKSAANDIIVRYILTESADWENRMQKDYVKMFIEDTSAYTHSIDTDFQEVVQFYSE